MDLMIAILMPTYNHQNFIAQSIEGVVNQQTKFKYKLFIVDDYSTDNNAQICQRFADANPDKIIFLRNERNFGAHRTGEILRKKGFSSNAKYLAICEGDDYWTDPYKLQKQVDFLEANEDYSICFHRVYELAEGNKPVLSNLNTSLKEESYTIEDLANGNFMYTPSVVFRNGLFKEFPSWLKDSPVGDYPLHMLNARHGKIKYFPDIMAVYRKHAGGLWSHHDVKINNVKMVKVIDFLLTEDFTDDVKTKLRLQKRKCINEYLHAVLAHDQDLFIAELRSYSEFDAGVLEDWAFVQYPALLNEVQQSLATLHHTMADIHESKAYKLSCKLAKLKAKLLP